MALTLAFNTGAAATGKLRFPNHAEVDPMSATLCRKATPVLYVETLAPSLAFWRDRLGFTVTAEVPGEDGTVFASLACGEIEVMLQTVASLTAHPHAGALGWRGERSFLFIEVDDIDALAIALANDPIVVPRHSTFYGATEIGYREP
ncbi:MAG: VOC family protein, partial [Dyella sp.]